MATTSMTRRTLLLLDSAYDFNILIPEEVVGVRVQVGTQGTILRPGDLGQDSVGVACVEERSASSTTGTPRSSRTDRTCKRPGTMCGRASCRPRLVRVLAGRDWPDQAEAFCPVPRNPYKDPAAAVSGHAKSERAAGRWYGEEADAAGSELHPDDRRPLRSRRIAGTVTSAQPAKGKDIQIPARITRNIGDAWYARRPTHPWSSGE